MNRDKDSGLWPSSYTYILGRALNEYQINSSVIFGSTSLCENSATHVVLHVDYLLTRGHPQSAAAAARPGKLT